MLTQFDRWLAAKGMPQARIEKRALGALFHWCVTTASFTVTPAVLLAQFGDGYAQRRPSGINTQAREYSISIENVAPSECNDILAFLKARNGVDVFNWTPPRGTVPVNVICPEWSSGFGSMIQGGTRLMNVSATFQEVFP